jgi:hypothetical protein
MGNPSRRMDNESLPRLYMIQKATDRQTRNLSGWMITENGVIGGGRPPMLHSITSGNGDLILQMSNFKSFLFFRYSNTEGVGSPDLQDSILATILTDLPALINLLFTHRLQGFGSDEATVWTKHSFLQRLKLAADEARIPDSSRTLLQWSETILRDWVAQNLECILIYGDETGLRVVPRSIISTLATLQRCVHAPVKTTREQEAFGRELMALGYQDTAVGTSYFFRLLSVIHY